MWGINATRSGGQNDRRERPSYLNGKASRETDSEARRDIFMKKITVLLICVLFYASVIQIVASTDEITEARISGENDAQGFQWKWFAASYMTTNASVIAIMLTYWTNEKLLHNSLNNIQPACCYTIYGAYVLTPTAVAIIDSPTPPADRLLGNLLNG